MPAHPFRGSSSGHSRQQLRARALRRESRDVYVLAERLPGWQLAAEVALVAVPGAVLSHRTAAAVHRLPVDRDGFTHLVRPPGAPVSERAGIRTHRSALQPGDVVDVHGLRVTALARTFLDLANELDQVELVALGDAIARRVGVPELQRCVAAARRRRGLAKARLAVARVDPGAESPGETRARLVLHDAGFTSLRHGVHVVDDAGQWLASPDLGDPDARVGVQYDGLVHLVGTEQRRKDIDRDELARAVGWQIVVVTARDLRQPHLLVEKVAAAHRRAAAMRCW